MFKKYGVEKYDAMNEPFDPHRHNAVFQLQDASKPAGTVAVVLKVFLPLGPSLFSSYSLFNPH